MCKKFISMLFVLLVAVLLAGCGMEINFGAGNTNLVRGSGNVISENRPVSGFTSVSINGSGDAILSQGESESLKIEAEDNILPLIESNVQNGKLIIGLKPGTSISTSRPIRYVITVKTLTEMAITGSGNAKVTNAIAAETLTVRTSGSGNIQLGDLTAKSLTALTSGSGRIDASGGKIENLIVTTSGSGNFNAPNLQATAANVTTSGSGSVVVWVKDTLSARTSGSGNVKYYGQPDVSRSESGSGRITGLGNK